MADSMALPWLSSLPPPNAVHRVWKGFGTSVKSVAIAVHQILRMRGISTQMCHTPKSCVWNVTDVRFHSHRWKERGEKEGERTLRRLFIFSLTLSVSSSSYSSSSSSFSSSSSSSRLGGPADPSRSRAPSSCSLPRTSAEAAPCPSLYKTSSDRLLSHERPVDPAHPCPEIVRCDTRLGVCFIVAPCMLRTPVSLSLSLFLFLPASLFSLSLSLFLSLFSRFLLFVFSLSLSLSLSSCP